MDLHSPFRQRAGAMERARVMRLLVGCACLGASIPAPGLAQTGWHFADRTVEAGLVQDGRPVEHGYDTGPHTDLRAMTGGAAAADYDGDGWLDLYVVRGNIGPNLLFRNRGDGTFEEVGAAAGVDALDGVGSGPLFADLDGDGWLDLIVGGFGPRTVTVFRNRGDGTFEDVTDASGIQHVHATFSIACSDYDFDGDLDLYTTHWGCPAAREGHLWRNDGKGAFEDVDEAANVVRFDGRLDYTFTPNFADITNDGRPDLLLAADFRTSQIFLNADQGRFVEAALGVEHPDENGMGAAIGDYDNDGDLDWFVTSVWDFDQDPEGRWGVSGNRMYRNQGYGTFEDATDFAGVREGDWGWGASFGDFNNDGWLDLVMVNGWRWFQFVDDPARLFVNTSDGRFEERGEELGVADRGQGRGVVVFDYDRDGDLDLLLANNSGPLRLLRNETPGTSRFVHVRLVGDAPNTQAIGARIQVRTGRLTQMRELRAGSNYVSSNPVEAHFGLGSARLVDALTIVWPDGRRDVHTSVAANALHTFHQTPTALALRTFVARWTPAGVRVSWELDADASTWSAVHVQRAAHAEGPFEKVARIDPVVRNGVYIDRDPTRGVPLWYRLILERSDGSSTVFAARAVDPSGNPRARAELLWARPRNDGVHVRYRVVGSPGQVTLRVFDARGRRVATPLRATRQAGSWTHVWEPRSAQGAPLPAGVYLLRLHTAAGVATVGDTSLKVALPRRE